jgi:ATP-binding cassette, subfamily A (ABC1), member 3
LHTITSGSIDVDGTGGLGYCPQKNVLWDELTVYEHVKIFNKLKATGGFDDKDQICNLVSACDLAIKLDARSKTLSGGQKRKLQLAMMFTGGSRVCCVDEVSSGLDPLSRRKIWDILLAERGQRTFMLTTHFLDEADVLADHVAVLSKGVLQAEGSAVELKHQYGEGYRVRIPGDIQIPHDFESHSGHLDGDQYEYKLGTSSEAARFVANLEEYGISDYQVNGPTIEDVFLRLAKEVHEDTPKQGQLTNAKREVPKADTGDQAVLSETSSQTNSDGNSALVMASGKGLGLVAQTWILFRKRFTVLQRNFLPYIVAVLVPIVTAGLVTLFLSDFSGLSCDPGAGASQQDTFGFGSAAALNTTEHNITIPVGPSDRVSVELLQGFTGLPREVFHVVNSLAEFQDYIAKNYATTKPGGIFLDSPPTFAYQGNWDIFYSVLTQSLVDGFLTGIPIQTSFEYLAVPFAPSAGQTLQLILYFGLAMSAYPGFFALYPTMERLRRVRALHYSNGIRAAPLWAAYLLFDFMFVLLISAVTVAIFVGVSSVWYAPGYLFVIFALYGLTAILMSYVISLFATSQLAAFAFAAGGQCSFFLLYFIIVMSIITYADPVHIDSNLTISNFTWNAITPSGTLLRTLLLALNEFSLLCRGNSKASYPGDIRIYGGPILYLIVQSLILLVFLIWWDSGSKVTFLRRRSAPRERNQSHAEASFSSERDPSVVAEAYRVDDNDTPVALKVSHISKQFGSNLAVDDISFLVRRSEIFSLLGPNGAGKSTTISLIRGDIQPTYRNGDVFVEGTSITKHRPKARTHLGVCPQFDAMDTMTVAEHLFFYARARGVPASSVAANVAAVTKAVGLTAYTDRLASKLSGGNKRKLSLAIALMGNPSVLLLDEPSSGMDAAAKRVMWRTLSAVTANRALLITTHSMEEADALANRAGIMARRMLAVGTTEDLRNTWGGGWYVHLVLRDKATEGAETERMQNVADWFCERVPGARVEGRMLHGQIRLRVPNAPPEADEKKEYGHINTASIDVDADDKSAIKVLSKPTSRGISKLFEVLENEGPEYGVEYYSVGRARLDQVFLEIVSRANVKEEGHEDSNVKGRYKNRGWLRWKKT